MEPTLEQIGRLAVRYVRAERALQAENTHARHEQQIDAWEDLYAAVQEYGAKVDPAGGAECSR